MNWPIWLPSVAIRLSSSSSGSRMSWLKNSITPKTSLPSKMGTPKAACNTSRAAFGVPILLGSEVLGVMEFFSHDIREPDEELLNLMATLGSQIGQFIERKRAEDALYHAQMELAHVTRLATLGELT